MTYLSMGWLLYDESYTKTKVKVTKKDLVKTITTNILVTLCISLLNIIPQLKLQQSLLGYIIHILCSFVVGDLCSYGFHRLLHHSSFYHFHKQHHEYIIPHTFVGVYCHPIEMAFNFASILISLTITSSYNNLTLIMETCIVAMGILLSHRADDHLLFDFGAKMHNIHHKELNCNYGFSMIMDWAFGTLLMN
jgi:sterol desaturase/sphingolipid hydroxylase (fatty acid hydroxylase superfamily)